MNTTEVNILLNKYFEGDTSLDEEKILKKYFTSGQVDPSLAEYIPVFTFHQAERMIKAKHLQEQDFINEPREKTLIPFYKSGRFWVYFSGIAASLLFLFTLMFETQFNNNPADGFAKTNYTEADAQKAYDQTRLALAYVSEKYAVGVEPLGDIAKMKAGSMAVDELLKFGAQINNINSNVDKMNSGVDNLSKLSKFTIIVKP